MTSSTCTTSATGNYITDFDGDFDGVVDFVDIVTGSTCDINNITFTGPSGNGNGDVKFALLPTHSKNLDWKVSADKQNITIDYFTSVLGSANGPCSSGCECRAYYEVDND